MVNVDFGYLVNVEKNSVNEFTGKLTLSKGRNKVDHNSLFAARSLVRQSRFPTRE